jgi:DnaJ-class molecular chaperone
MSNNYANDRAFAAGQARWDNMSPPEDEDGLQECDECNTSGLIEDMEGTECPFCEGKGYFLDDHPMSKAEYERHIENMRD